MTPLLLCALGLAICYRANVWNIGAEGPAGGRRPRGRRDRAAGHAGVAAARSSLLVILAGHRRRRGLGRGHRLAARPLQRQRDPGEPDADLRRPTAAALPGARRAEGSARATTFRTAGCSKPPPPYRGCCRRTGSTSAWRSRWCWRCWRGCSSSARASASSCLRSATRRCAARYAGFSSRLGIWVSLLACGALRGTCRRLRGGGPDRPADAEHLARLRLRRDHRRLARQAESARLHPGGVPDVDDLHRRRIVAVPARACRTAITGVFQGVLLLALLCADTFIHYRIGWKPWKPSPR